MYSNGLLYVDRTDGVYINGLLHVDRTDGVCTAMACYMMTGQMECVQQWPVTC